MLLVEPGGDPAGRGDDLDVDLRAGGKRRRRRDQRRGRETGEMPGHCTNSASGALSQPVTDASGRKIAAAAAWTSSAVTS